MHATQSLLTKHEQNMHYDYASFASHSFTGSSSCSDSFFCVRAKHSANSTFIGCRSSKAKLRSRRPKNTLDVVVPSVACRAAERVIRTLFLDSKTRKVSLILQSIHPNTLLTAPHVTNKSQVHNSKDSQIVNVYYKQ